MAPERPNRYIDFFKGDSDFSKEKCMVFSRFFQAHVSSKMRTDLAYEGRMTIAPRRAP
jgi:hypothetical protein